MERKPPEGCTCPMGVRLAMGHCGLQATQLGPHHSLGCPSYRRLTNILKENNAQKVDNVHQLQR